MRSSRTCWTPATTGPTKAYTQINGAFGVRWLEAR